VDRARSRAARHDHDDPRRDHVNIAIPTLQVDLKAGSYADISWVVTGYMLAQGAVIPMAGWASDRFGTKRLYLVTSRSSRSRRWRAAWRRTFPSLSSSASCRGSVAAC